MNINMQAVRSYLGQAAQTAKELSSQAAVAAKDLSSQVVGAKCLRDYTVQGLTGSAGPGCMWKIFAARGRKEGTSNPLASVWILDKRSVSEASRGNARTAEAFLQLCRKDAANLAKLKHPNVVRLLEPFEETRSQLLMVTEAVAASVADVLRLRKASSADSSGAGSLQLSELEIKHGFLQVADGLHFLHTQANQIHRNISPEAICITGSGAWKLADFGFAMLAEFGNSNPAEAAFDYSDSASSLTAQALKPTLSYTAPELVVGCQQSSGGLFSAADVFSLGILMYEVIGDRQLLDVGQSSYEYYSKIASFQQLDLSAVPYELQSLLVPMLSTAPSARSSAISITGSQYFQGDVMLRALRFMDSMIQRDTMQKAAFLNDLATFWDRFDDRVLRLKVLPHLLEEVRSEQLQQLVLPLVIHILGKQDRQDFADTTAPALMPIFQSAKGDTLLLLTRSTPTLLKTMPRPYVTSMLVPLLVRAADQGDTRCQDEMLKQLPAVAEQTEYTTLKTELLPRMHQLCLKTVSASVRVNSLMCMSKVAARLDEEEAGKMLQTAAKVSAVDHTAPTVMCVLSLGESIAKQYGLGMAAQQVLPLLTPLLVQPTLSGPQFAQAICVVKNILGQIESKRARELELPDSNAVSAGISGRPSSNPGTPKAGLPSWDNPTFTGQPPSHPSRPQTSAPHNQSSSMPSSEPSWQNSKPSSQPSWQSQKPTTAMRAAAASAGPIDPFAGLPAPQANPPSYQGGANDLTTDSLFSSLATGQTRPSSYAQPSSRFPAPGNQLANVMDSSDTDALFMDPSWRDPQLNGTGSGVGLGSGAAGLGSGASLGSRAGVPFSSSQNIASNLQSNAAADLFSQLSLSRNPSGATSSSSVPSRPANSVTANGRQGSGMSNQWQNQTATKGLIAPISLGASKQSNTLGQRPGGTPVNRTGVMTLCRGLVLCMVAVEPGLRTDVPAGLIVRSTDATVIAADLIGMSQTNWRLLDRRFSGTTLLVTGAVGLTLGWVSAALWQYSTAVEEAPTEQDNQEDNESLAEAESNYSEPTTPRSFGQSRQTPRRTNTGLKFDSSANAAAEYKQVILIRTDLDMGTGKAAAQACHASVSAVKKAWRQKDPAYKAWEANNAMKICLGVDSAQALISVKEQARDAGLVTAMIIDTGVPSRDRTILAIGPGLTAKIDAITRQLKLFDEA